MTVEWRPVRGQIGEITGIHYGNIHRKATMIDAAALAAKAQLLTAAIPDDASDIELRFWSMENLPKPFAMMKYEQKTASSGPRAAYFYRVTLKDLENALRKK